MPGATAALLDSDPQAAGAHTSKPTNTPSSTRCITAWCQFDPVLARAWAGTDPEVQGDACVATQNLHRRGCEHDAGAATLPAFFDNPQIPERRR